MRFNGLTPKQKQIFRWPYSDKYDAIICDGAIRSGKTVCMVSSFILWSMRQFNNCIFAICGKTVTSAERNIINPLLDMEDIKDIYKLTYKKIDNCLTVTDGKTTNYYYVFGGKDESSAALIQGMTLAGVLLDEVALMPRSFVEQALARCSMLGSKFWFNCNPDSPSHWFYKEWILKDEEKKALRIHFTLNDNPALAQEIKDRYEKTYTGVFYNRFVLGQWVAADGLVYDIDINSVVLDNDSIPEKALKKGRWFISVDYGTMNPFAALLWVLDGKTAYIVNEYYYNGREKLIQKTDEDYYKELLKLAGDRYIEHIIIDPSAASMIATIRKHGYFSVRKAKNSVLDGIRFTSTLLKQNRIKISPECTGLISELSLYRWDDKKTSDTVIKENDHACDAMRYFCYTILRNEWRFD